jgi:protein-disulfide isomerase
MGLLNRRELLAVVLAAAAGSSAMAGDDDFPRGPSGVALVLVQDPGCPYCARWTTEVWPGLSRAPENVFAPLTRLLRADPRAGRFAGIAYSPTFIVLKGNDEIGRIVGYPGADFFWGYLDNLLAKAGFRRSDSQG